MLTLFQWNLVLRHNTPLAVGIVSGHRKLEEGTRVHTSPILQASETKDGLILKTASGSVYHLRAEEWRPRQEESLSPEELNLSPDFWTRCARAQEEAAARRTRDLETPHQSGTLWLRMVGPRILSAFWTGGNAREEEAAVLNRPGMPEDSYIITGLCQGAADFSELDFRLFQKWNRLEPYRISPSLKLLLICNAGSTDITFGSSERNILCGAGTVTRIPAESLSGH